MDVDPAARDRLHHQPVHRPPGAVRQPVHDRTRRPSSGSPRLREFDRTQPTTTLSLPTPHRQTAGLTTRRRSSAVCRRAVLVAEVRELQRDAEVVVSFSLAITAWRSSRFFPLHPQLVALHLVAARPSGPGPSGTSRSRAPSRGEIPMLRVTVWRTAPLEASSTFPYESAFSETLRLTSFSSSTCVSALQPVLARGVELDRLLAELDRAVGALEVEARADLTTRLVDRVADLLEVHLGDHVECRHACAEYRYCRRPGSVPEWPKGAVCKTAARATLVRIQPGPPLVIIGRDGARRLQISPGPKSGDTGDRYGNPLGRVPRARASSSSPRWCSPPPSWPRVPTPGTTT